MNFNNIIRDYSHGVLPVIKLPSGLYGAVVGIYPGKVTGVIILFVSGDVSIQVYGTTTYEFDENTRKWNTSGGGAVK